MRASRRKQEGIELLMQTLQTTGREKNIQNKVRAIAKCMMLLWLPSVQLKLVNGIDRDQERKEEQARQA
jgi:hypothetical protein